MKYGKTFKLGKHKAKYVYMKKEVRGRTRTVKKLLVLSGGTWLMYNSIRAYNIWRKLKRGPQPIDWQLIAGLAALAFK